MSRLALKSDNTMNRLEYVNEVKHPANGVRVQPATHHRQVTSLKGLKKR